MRSLINNKIKIVLITAVLSFVLAGIAQAYVIVGVVNQPGEDFRPGVFKMYNISRTSGISSGDLDYRMGLLDYYTYAGDGINNDTEQSWFAPGSSSGDIVVCLAEKENYTGTTSHEGYYAVNNVVLNGSPENFIWSDFRLVPMPTGLSSVTQIDLSWSAAVDDGSGNILGYNIYRSEDPTFATGVTKLNSSVIAGLSYTDSTAVTGTYYYYSISVVFRGTLATTEVESKSSINSNRCRRGPQDITPPIVNPSYPVTDGNIPMIDIDSQLATDTISANWVNTFTDPESGIWYYEYAVGSTSGGTDVVGWTNVGALTGMTNNSVALINGNTYYVSVRATNNDLLSSVSTSDGVTIEPPDPTPPDTTTAFVNDGTGADIDVQYSTNSLSANWGGFADPESGIAGYTVAVGSSEGGSEIVAWTGTGTTTNITLNGLTLTFGTRYYVTVRAYNGAGLFSPLSSDGVTVLKNKPDIAINYPNPFDPIHEQTRIVIQLEEPTNVGLYIYNIAAKIVWKYTQDFPAAGTYEIVWDGMTYYNEVADNGVYLLRVVDEDGKKLIAKGKILVVKKQ